MMKTKLLLMFATVLAFQCLTVVADIPAELPDPDTTPPDTTKPVKVFILSGQSNMVGMGNISPLGTLGTLETITKTDGLFPNLIDDEDDWTVRNDVMYRGVITAIGDGLLTPGFGSNSSAIGPELGFGHVMGYYYDEPVIVLKTSQGNRSLGWDCLPPGSVSYIYNNTNYGGYGDYGNWPVGDDPPTTGGWYAGKQYDDYFLDEADMGPKDWVVANLYTVGCQVYNGGIVYNCKVEHTSTAALEPGTGGQSSSYWDVYSIFNVTDILDNFASEYPEYAAQGFKIVGYGWWQGHKDQYDASYADRYELNLVNFINETRRYYENRYPANITPDAPFVVATIGFGGVPYDPDSAYGKIHAAQMAVGDLAEHPEFEDNVASFDTLGFWRDIAVSPVNQDYHYNRNAETYMLVGDAMGRAMAEMLAPYSVDSGANMITWSGEPVELDATVQEDVTVTSYAWSADPAAGVVFDSDSIEDPTVTITKASGDAATITFTLTVNDGINIPVTDKMTIDVYDTPCLAARLGLDLTTDNPTDLSGDCVTSLEDIAVIAEKWLNDVGLTEPVPKP